MPRPRVYDVYSSKGRHDVQHDEQSIMVADTARKAVDSALEQGRIACAESNGPVNVRYKSYKVEIRPRWGVPLMEFGAVAAMRAAADKVDAEEAASDTRDT